MGDRTHIRWDETAPATPHGQLVFFHSDQTTLYLTPMHAEVGLIKSMIANVHEAIRHIRRGAAQLPKIDRWATLPGYLCQPIVGQVALPTPPPALGA